LPRIASWNKQTGVMGIPAAWVDSIAPAGFSHSPFLELTVHQMWAIAVLRVQRMQREGQEIKITFCEPEARIQAEHPWPTPFMKEPHRSPFFLSNAIELLDEPGEWYLDRLSHRLYYWPRQGERPEHMEAIVPVLETLVQVEGTADSPVSNVRFEGITFNYATWLRPSLQGHVPLQAGMYLLDAYSLKPPGVPGNENKGLENQAWIGRQPGAVQLKHVRQTLFERCRFEHLAAAGLDYDKGSLKDTIRGCLFRDIGGNALQLGHFSDPGMETHLPYDPLDRRDVCAAMSVTNNLIQDAGSEDWGCVGIAAGYVQGFNISHNDVADVP
jgi:hypothetical protein